MLTDRQTDPTENNTTLAALAVIGKHRFRSVILARMSATTIVFIRSHFFDYRRLSQINYKWLHNEQKQTKLV